MNTMVRVLGLFALLFAIGGVPSCSPPAPPSGTYQVDTVRFVLSPQTPAGTGLGPGIWIDTNIKISGLGGGTVTSSKPYAIAFDSTDNTFSLTTLEFTSVEVIYDDGEIDPGAKALKMPLKINARAYETVNSMSGGQIVRTMTRIFSGKMSGAITRDEPFRLRIEGRFTRNDGSIVPFAIDHRYDIEKESSTKAAGEVLRDG